MEAGLHHAARYGRVDRGSNHVCGRHHFRHGDQFARHRHHHQRLPQRRKIQLYHQHSHRRLPGRRCLLRNLRKLRAERYAQRERPWILDRFHRHQAQHIIRGDTRERASRATASRRRSMNRFQILLAAVFLVLASAFVVRAANPPDVPPAPVAIVIQNATILTVSHGTIEHGSILIVNGKIAEVGQSVHAPKDAQVIDAAGQFVMPGIVDCHSHIAVDGSVNEGSISVSSIVNIAEVLNPDDVDIYRDLAGGVTVANILHGSANSIGGQTVVIKLRWGQPAAKLPFEGALPGIKFALGENPKRSNFSFPGQPKRYPASRMGVEETIRSAFTEARDYKATWDVYNKRFAAGDKSAIPPRRDLRLEPLVEVLEGKRYVHAHCYREDEILMLLRVAKEFGFKVRTLQHVLEGYKVADEIAASGAGASTFSDWWSY